MATYRFRVWPNGSAPYIVTGNGISWIYAKENVARREGVDLFDVMPVNGNAPIDDDSLSSSNSKNNISNPIGTVILLGILLFFGAILTYWKIILICAIITGIIWWWYNK